MDILDILALAPSFDFDIPYTAGSTVAVRDPASGERSGEAVACYATFGGKRLLDPGSLYLSATEYGGPKDFWQRANSYTCPRGKEPGTGWLLMLRKDLDTLDLNALHELKWYDGKRTLKIPSLIIVKANCMAAALAGDEDAPYLLKVADKRQMLKMSSMSVAYNVRRPVTQSTTEPAPSNYTTASLESSAITWTWKTMLDDIWGDLPTTYVDDPPQMPFAPHGVPEGFRFHGVSAWEAYHAVLEKLNCTTIYDPIADTFSVVSLGATQDGLESTLQRLQREGRQIYDYDPASISGTSYPATRTAIRANIPDFVSVYFRKYYHMADFSRTMTGIAPLVDFADEFYFTNVQLTNSGVSTIVPLWDDLPAIYDREGTALNSAAVAARAAERAAKYLASLNNEDGQWFLGAATVIKPGSQVSSVTWRDYGDVDGLLTEIETRWDNPNGISQANNFLEQRSNATQGVAFLLQYNSLNTPAPVIDTTTATIPLENQFNSFGGYNGYFGDVTAYTLGGSLGLGQVGSIIMRVAGRYQISWSAVLSATDTHTATAWVEIDPNGDGNWATIGYAVAGNGAARSAIRAVAAGGLITAASSWTTLADAKVGTIFRCRAACTGSGSISHFEVVFVRCPDPIPSRPWLP